MNRRWAAAAFLGVALGCSFITDLSKLGSDGGVTDAATLDAGASDAADSGDSGGRACDPTKKFTTPAVPVTSINSSYGEICAFLTATETNVYFTRNLIDADGGSNVDLFVASRPDASGTFTNPTPLAIDGPSLDACSSLTGDELTLYFHSLRDAGGPAYRIYEAQRAKATDAFGAVTLAAGPLNATPLSTTRPYVLPTGNVMYVTYNGADIYQTTLKGNAWQTPVPVPGVNSNTDLENGQAVTPDELTIYFASERNTSNPTNYDIWVGTRAKTTDAFQVQAVDELHSDFNETPTWISPDGCRLYFESSQTGANDIYMATKPP